MEGILIAIIVIQALVYSITFYILNKQDKNFAEKLTLYQSDVTQTMIEQMARVEKTHLEQLEKHSGKLVSTHEKQSSKQMALFEKQTQNFIKAMTDFIVAMQPKEAPVLPLPDFLNHKGGENTIEKEEEKDYFLDEISRIPNIADVNVRFQDEEQILGDKLE